jgi:hypothetical protein
MAHEAEKRPVVSKMVIPPERANGQFGRIFSKLLDNIRNAPAGQRHRLVVSNCFAVGGYVASGYIEQGDAESAIINAVAGMHPDADKTDLERTAVGSLVAGMGEPLVIEQNLAQSLGDLL